MRSRARATVCIFMTALLGAVRTQVSDVPVYTFPSELPICPLVMISPNPSFILQPSRVGSLTGMYDDPNVEGFDFTPTDVMCFNETSCTQLAVQYRGSETSAIGTLEITYRPFNGQEIQIMIQYATAGIYLETPRVVLMPASDGFLDGGLLVYDVSRFTQPFVLCEADTGNHTQFLGSAKEHEGCAVSKQGAGLPSRLEIVAEIGETTGSHNFYVAAESCSSSERSQIFTISLDGPTTPAATDTEVTTTTEVGGTGGPGNSNAVIIGVVVSLAVVVVGVAIVALACVGYLYRHRSDQRKPLGPENGSLHVDRQSPDISHNTARTHTRDVRSNGDLHTPSRPPLDCIYIAGKHYSNFEASLAECHGVECKNFEDSGIKLVRGVVSKQACIVYIVRDGSSEDTGDAPRPAHMEFLSQLESLPSDRSHKNSVFVIQFQSKEQSYVERPHYHIITRPEDPNDKRFNPSSCAKSIVDEVTLIRGEETHQEAVDSPDTKESTEAKDSTKTKAATHGALHIHVENLNVRMDSGQDEAIEKVDKGMKKGFGALAKLITETGQVIQSDLEVIGDNQNEQANIRDERTVIPKCTPP